MSLKHIVPGNKEGGNFTVNYVFFLESVVEAKHFGISTRLMFSHKFMLYGVIHFFHRYFLRVGYINTIIGKIIGI
jgi:hypothetical protein